jgi:hypothetical protein
MFWERHWTRARISEQHWRQEISYAAATVCGYDFAAQPVGYSGLCVVLTQKLYNLSHQMFRLMHEALNIGKKIINYTVCMYFTRQIF